MSSSSSREYRNEREPSSSSRRDNNYNNNSRRSPHRSSNDNSRAAAGGASNNNHRPQNRSEPQQRQLNTQHPPPESAPIEEKLNYEASVNKVQSQMEYYMSDGNLLTDAYLRDALKEKRGNLPFSLFGNFRKIQDICTNYGQKVTEELIRESVKQSGQFVVKDKSFERRVSFNEKDAIENVYPRTYFVVNFLREVRNPVDFIKNIFKEYENDIDAIHPILSIENGRFDGCAFVTFKDTRIATKIADRNLKADPDADPLQFVALENFLKDNEIKDMEQVLEEGREAKRRYLEQRRQRGGARGRGGRGRGRGRGGGRGRGRGRGGPPRGRGGGRGRGGPPRGRGRDRGGPPRGDRNGDDFRRSPSGSRGRDPYSRSDGYDRRDEDRYSSRDDGYRRESRKRSRDYSPESYRGGNDSRKRARY